MLARFLISEDAKAAISLWLEGEYEPTWSEQFTRMFDSLFGHNHLSVKCFARSSIASVLGVFLLYLLFDWETGYFFKPDTSIKFILITGISVNIAVDYVLFGFRGQQPMSRIHFGLRWAIIVR